MQMLPPLAPASLADLELVRSRAAGAMQQAQLLIHYTDRPDIIGSPEPEQVVSWLRSKWKRAIGCWPWRLSFPVEARQGTWYDVERRDELIKGGLTCPSYDWFLGYNLQSTCDDALHLLYELGCAASGRPLTLGSNKPEQARGFDRSFQFLVGLAMDHPDRLGQRFKWWDGGQVAMDAGRSAPEAEWWLDLDCFHAIAVAAELACRRDLGERWHTTIPARELVCSRESGEGDPAADPSWCVYKLPEPVHGRLPFPISNADLARAAGLEDADAVSLQIRTALSQAGRAYKTGARGHPREWTEAELCHAYPFLSVNGRLKKQLGEWGLAQVSRT